MTPELIASPIAFQQARKRVGLTAYALARVLRTAPETVGRWEAGVQRIPGPAAVAMALILTHGINDVMPDGGIRSRGRQATPKASKGMTT